MNGMNRMKRVCWAAGFLLSSAWIQGVQAAQLTGQLAYAQEAELGTLSSGVVREVAVKVGDQVRRGNTLLRLDSRAFEAQLQAAKARHSHAELLQQEAQAEHDRAEELYERTVLSEVERTQAQLGLLSAQATAATAAADLMDARLALEYAHIKAPFDGLVVAVEATAGEVVVNEQQAVTLLVLARTSRMELRVPIDPAAAQSAMADAAPRVRVAGRDFPAAHLALSNEPGEWVLLVEFDVPADMTLKAGQIGQLIWGQ